MKQTHFAYSLKSLIDTLFMSKPTFLSFASNKQRVEWRAAVVVIQVSTDDKGIGGRVVVRLDDVVNLLGLSCPASIVGVVGGRDLSRVSNPRVDEFGFEMVDPDCK